MYNIQLHVDSAAYTATSLDQQPTFGTEGSTETAKAQPTAALMLRWPFMRSDETTGTQTVEPIVQLVGGPNAGRFIGRNIPNEDSLDMEFTDANLFSINRFPGIDRTEGGLRANVGVHGNWQIGSGSVDAVVGQVYREHVDQSFPLKSGLNRHVSDVVARTTFTPSNWLDLTARTRVDPRNGNIGFADAIASAGQPLLRLSAGYLYSSTNPYFLFDQAPSTLPPTGYPASYFIPRDEVTLGFSTQRGPYKLSSTVTRDLTTSKLDSIGAVASYEDECFVFDVNFNKRYTSIDNDNGGTIDSVPDHLQDGRAVRFPRILRGRSAMRQPIQASLLLAALAILPAAAQPGAPRHIEAQPVSASPGTPTEGSWRSSTGTSSARRTSRIVAVCLRSPPACPSRPRCSRGCVRRSPGS